MAQEFISRSNSQTKQFASKIAKKLKGGEILALSGDLGSGKTTFTQGLAEGLGIRDNITSPTFVLMKSYKLPAISYKLIHIDAYRMDSEQDALSIGITDYLREPNTICVIEWPEIIEKLLPKNTIWIQFKHMDENSREITIN